MVTYKHFGYPIRVAGMLFFALDGADGPALPDGVFIAFAKWYTLGTI